MSTLAAGTGDLVARLGGDEFVFLLDDVARIEEAEEVGHRVVTALGRPFVVRGESVHVSVSVGATLGERRRTTAEELLSRADAAMYEAKRGGGRVVRDTVLATAHPAAHAGTAS